MILQLCNKILKYVPNTLHLWGTIGKGDPIDLSDEVVDVTEFWAKWCNNSRSSELPDGCSQGLCSLHVSDISVYIPCSIIYVLRNLRICATSRLCCALLEPQNCIPTLRLHSQSKDCIRHMRNPKIAWFAYTTYKLWTLPVSLTVSNLLYSTEDGRHPW